MKQVCVEYLTIYFEIVSNGSINLLQFIEDPALTKTQIEKNRIKYLEYKKELFIYLSDMNINFTYEKLDDYVYKNIQFDYTNAIFDFLTNSILDKKSFILVNLFILFKNGACLSKQQIERLYGDTISYKKMKNMFRKIEDITSVRIEKNKDLSYCMIKKEDEDEY